MRTSKLIALLLAMCFCMSGCGTVTDTSEQQQLLKQEGMELQAAGDYSGAIAKYEEALRLQVEVALKTYYDPTSKQVMEKVLEKFGYVKMKQPRKWDNSKYEVRELDEILSAKDMKQGVLVTVANHHTCIVDGHIQDIWDCGEMSVGNYYVKR